MEDRAVRGVPWTLLTYMGNKVFTVVTMIVLTRLLTPTDFGVMAIAMLAIIFLGYFGNFGLQATLILRPEMSRRAQGTVLTLMLAAGTLVAIALAGLSPLLADLFHEPSLTGVLVAMASTLVFGGPRWFYEALMQRELEFGARFRAQLASSVTTAALSIVLAAAGAGVWSLAWGFVVGGLVHAVALLLLAPYRVGLAFDRHEARQALLIGRGFVAQGGLAFVEDNIDYMAIGRVLGPAQLGFYSMAYRLSELPYYGIADPVAKVTFPSFARMRHAGEDVSSAFLTSLRLVALVTCPLGVVLSGAADPFTRTLLGPDWIPMIGVLGILGIWAMVRPTHATLAWLLNSVGAAGLLSKISAATLVALVPAVVVAAHLGSTHTVAWVVLAHVSVSSLILAVVGSRQTGIGLARYWRALKPVLIATPLSWAATRLVADASGHWAPFFSLTAATAAGFAVFACGASIVEPGALSRAVAQVARTLGREAGEKPESSPPGRLSEVRRN